MEYIKYRLFKESIRFIEICQFSALSGCINRETYSSLVNMKLEFLKNMIEYEKTKIYFVNQFSSRIDGIIRTDNIILA